jgi:hypothetical protein
MPNMVMPKPCYTNRNIFLSQPKSAPQDIKQIGQKRELARKNIGKVLQCEFAAAVVCCILAYPSKAETRNKSMVEESKCHECNGWYSIDDGKNVIELEGPLPWFVV